VEIRLPQTHRSFGLEWHVEEGAQVVPGQVLAWLSIPDHCALVALASPAAGRLTTRWTSLLTSGEAGEVVAELESDGAACRASERAALLAAIEQGQARLRTLAVPSTLGAVMAGERSELERWLTAATRHVEAPSQAAQTR